MILKVQHGDLNSDRTDARYNTRQAARATSDSSGARSGVSEVVLHHIVSIDVQHSVSDKSAFILSEGWCCHRRRIRLAARRPRTATWPPRRRRLSRKQTGRYQSRRAAVRSAALPPGDGSTGTSRALPKKRNGFFSSSTFSSSRTLAWSVTRNLAILPRLCLGRNARTVLTRDKQTFFVKYLDQTNITNAYISGMKEDLNLSTYNLRLAMRCKYPTVHMY